MNPIKVQLTLLTDKDPAIRALIVKDLTTKNYSTKYLKEILSQSNPPIKENLIRDILNTNDKQLLLKAMYKDKIFCLFEAINSFNQFVFDEKQKINCSLFGKKAIQWQQLSQILHKNKIALAQNMTCEIIDFSFRDFPEKKTLVLTLLYSLIKKQQPHLAKELKLATCLQSNKHYLYNTKYKTVLDSDNNWQEITKGNLEFKKDYTLFSQFVMKSYWLVLIQGDLNSIYQVGQVMKIVFKNCKLGYPFE